MGLQSETARPVAPLCAVSVVPLFVVWAGRGQGRRRGLARARRGGGSCGWKDSLCTGVCVYARARARVTLWCVCARERVPRPAGWMGVEAVNAVRCLDREASQGSEESTAAPGALRPRVHCLHGSTAAPGSSTDPGASYGRRFGGELPADPPLSPGEIRDLVRYVNAQHKRPTCRSAAGQPAPRRQGSRLESPADAKTAFLSLSLSLSLALALSLFSRLSSLSKARRGRVHQARRARAPRAAEADPRARCDSFRRQRSMQALIAPF